MSPASPTPHTHGRSNPDRHHAFSGVGALHRQQSGGALGRREGEGSCCGGRRLSESSSAKFQTLRTSSLRLSHLLSFFQVRGPRGTRTPMRYRLMALALGRSDACGSGMMRTTRNTIRRWMPLHSTWARQPFGALSRISLSTFRFKATCCSDLWGTHPPHSTVRTSVVRSSISSAAAHKAKDAQPGAPPERSDTAIMPAAAPSPISFTLDPPFTRVKGEEELSPGPCVYVCRRCRAPVFHSDNLADTSRVGWHSSGWPTFLAPSAPSALRLSTVLQKSVVARLSDTSRDGSATNIAAGLTTPRQTLEIAVPQNSVAQRGLTVEGDFVRRRGRTIRLQDTRTWRETCLRDENHRADPVLVLACCSSCDTPLCHVTQSAAAGTRYVSTAACIMAEAVGATPPE
ncbi:hypothetical protein, conserved [Leishmania tarentolae]|uniref:Uncharacterized protein n=1 Tax=Leishmania tarentolae TaxID=5689 RepID=A0A640K7N5_LEITA|nr:hypothetical protein, conserved [Leishmania tarentolae]